MAQAWLAEIGPAPHLHFSSHEKLACWVTLCPGNNISAKKRKHGRTGDAGTYVKPMLVQAAWNAIRVRGRLQARYNRLVRRFGGPQNPAAKKKAITAIAHTLLEIAYQVLKSGTPYQDLGADFYDDRLDALALGAQRLDLFIPLAGADRQGGLLRPPGGRRGCGLLQVGSGLAAGGLLRLRFGGGFFQAAPVPGNCLLHVLGQVVVESAGRPPSEVPDIADPFPDK